MGIYYDKAYANGAFAKPSDDVDPNVKSGKQWCLQQVKYIYGMYVTGKTAFDTSWGQKVDRIRSYAWGNQDTSQYKKLLLGDEETPRQAPAYGSDLNPPDRVDESQKGWMNVNFEEVLSPLPKYVLKVLGMFANTDVDVEIDAIDESSMDRKTMEKFKIQLKADNLEWMNEVRRTVGLPEEEPDSFMPKTKDEIQMFEALGGIKLPYEIGLERALDFTFTDSNLKSGKDKAIHDLFCIGKTAYMSLTDPYTRKAKAKYIDVRDVIIEFSREDHFENSRFAGVPLDYTVEDLRAETGMSEQEILNIVTQFKGKLGNPSDTTFDTPETYEETGNCNYNSYHIPCVYMVWKSTDTTYHTTRKTKAGREVSFYEPYKKNGPRVYNTDKKQTSSQSIKRLYHAKWIIGTDVVWDHGLMYDQPYDYTKKDCILPIRVVTLLTKPPLWSMIPIEDQICLAFFRMQNNIAIAPPPGLAIEWGALEDLTYENGKIKPLDAIRMRSQTGNIVYRLKPVQPGENGNYNQMPIQELKGGVGDAIIENIRTMENCYTQLAEMSGIDRISTASKTPTGEMGVGTVEMAVAATNDVLRPIFNAWTQLKEQLSRVVLHQILSIVYTDEKMESVYYSALGRPAAMALNAISEYDPIELGLKVVARPTDAEKQAIQRAAEIALTNGKNGSPTITYSEYIFIINRMTSGTNLKYIQAFLSFREGEKSREDQALQAQVLEQQTKSAAELQNKKTQDQMALEQMALQRESSILKLKYDLELRNAKEIHPLKMEEIMAQKGEAPPNPAGAMSPAAFPIPSQEDMARLGMQSPQGQPMAPQGGMPPEGMLPEEEQPAMGMTDEQSMALDLGEDMAENEMEGVE